MLSAIKKLASRVVDEVKAARAPAPTADEGAIDLPEYAIKTPGTQEAIVLPRTRTFDKPPTPEQFRAEARRIAFAYAMERSGKPELTWKQAKLLLDRWEKEEKATEREAQRAKPVENPHIAAFMPPAQSDLSKKLVIAKR